MSEQHCGVLCETDVAALVAWQQLWSAYQQGLLTSGEMEQCRVEILAVFPSEIAAFISRCALDFHGVSSELLNASDTPGAENEVKGKRA